MNRLLDITDTRCKRSQT